MILKCVCVGGGGRGKVNNGISGKKCQHFLPERNSFITSQPSNIYGNIAKAITNTIQKLFQVSRETHAYTSDIEAREEGGTPAIIESIRTGLAFQLKKVCITLYLLTTEFYLLV